MLKIGENVATITVDNYDYEDVATIDESVSLTASTEYCFQPFGTVNVIVASSEPTDISEGFVIQPYEKFTYIADATNKLYFSAAYGTVKVNIAEVPSAS